MCKRLMLSRAALFLIFVGVLPKAIHCMPAASSDPVYNGGSVQDVPTQPPNGQCVPFFNHYCNQFDNRNMAYFPNPRGHPTPEAAAAEFDDYIPLLKSGCHPKLGTLLCFMYFPQCGFPGYPDLKIYPCKETCQEVTRSDSECTKLLNDYGFSWNKALQCDKPHFKSGGLCANGDAPAFLDNNITSTDNSTSPDVQPTEEAPADSVDVETTEEPTDSMDVETTEEPTDSEEQCDSDSCPSGCDYRENANSKTFERNAYCYAARVTVKSHKVRDCHHTYTVEVKNQYDLQLPFNSTHSTKAPSMGDSAVIFTSRSHCTRCPKLEVNKTYLISGSYSRAADGSVQWRLGDSKDQALVSEWSSKYDRKLTSFVNGGNSARENNSSFKQVCENDARLVSAEQWVGH